MSHIFGLLPRLVVAVLFALSAPLAIGACDDGGGGNEGQQQQQSPPAQPSP